MTPEQAEALPFDPLDDTKTWSEEDFPLMKVGLMKLNKNPDNFFAQVEQSAFCPGNIIPGIELSADKMLQGRSFSYLDTQRYRIGANFAQLPINKPINPVNNNQADGEMRYDYSTSPVNYYPNSLAGGNPHPTGAQDPSPVYTEGYIERRVIKKTDDFTQAGERYRSLSEDERLALCDNIASELYMCDEGISSRVLSYFSAADADFGSCVEDMMKKYK